MLARRQQLQVFGIAASPVAASVVNMHPLGDRPMRLLPGVAMRIDAIRTIVNPVVAIHHRLPHDLASGHGASKNIFGRVVERSPIEQMA